MKTSITILFTLSLAIGCAAIEMVESDYYFEDRSCRCKVRKTEAFWTFIDTSSMMNILIKWNPSVHEFQSTPWSTMRQGKAPNAISHVFNYTCDFDNEITRMIDYKTMVKAPIFLQPFVSDRLIHQNKNQFIFNCKEDDLLVFKEDCVIDDIPIIPDIRIHVKTLMKDGEHPIAIATLKHQALPWYMKIVQSMLRSDIAEKAQSLWKITVQNLCQCTSL